MVPLDGVGGGQRLEEYVWAAGQHGGSQGFTHRRHLPLLWPSLRGEAVRNPGRLVPCELSAGKGGGTRCTGTGAVFVSFDSPCVMGKGTWGR